MLLATVTIAAVALHGWQMHATSVTVQRESLNSIAVLGAAQLSDAVRDITSGEQVDESLIQRFSRWSTVALRQPRVLAAVLRNPEGRVLSSVPSEAGQLDALALLPVGRRSCIAQQTGMGGDSPTATLLASHPISVPDEGTLLGDVIVVASTPTMVSAWAMWSLTFGLPLAVVASLGFVVGLRWLRRRVHQPLADLVRRSDEDEAQWLARLPIDRRDELGRIARGTGALADELRELRNELADLRTTVDVRVAEQTRAINEQLRNAQRQVWQDPLTGLGNRRLLDERLEQVFKAQGQASADLVAIMFDIDHFKAHNDTMGHAAGDDLLRFFGQLLRGSLRQTDLAFRYAGDEFLVLLTQTLEKDALHLAERIVRLFAQQTSLLETTPQPTLSAGIAALTQCGAPSGQSLVQAADAALYCAKAKGKNSVSVARRGAVPVGMCSAIPA